MEKVVFILFFSLLIICKITFATTPPCTNVNGAWADSLMAKMTLDEKIGQLLMVASNPWLKEKQEQFLLDQVEKYKVGGILFLKTTPYAMANQTNKCQQKSKIPLFIAIDGENGLSFRMDSTVVYPNAIALGAMSNDSLLYRMGREIGQQCRLLGINLNFAPVADVNSNPENPVIGYRSFGEDPQRVTSKCLIYAKGLQDENIMVSVKHFPGHGNTDEDSHETLPVIKGNYRHLDTVDFVPFKACIESGINGIMTAHIQMPEIDKSKRPATLSKKIITGILRDSLGFEGIIFSDAMNMKGITALYNEGDAAVEAFKAGVDVIEFVQQPGKIINAVKNAIQQGSIKEASINEKCRKVLLAKTWAGLPNYQPADIKRINKELNKPEYQLTARLLAEQSLTVIRNERNLLPLQRLDTLRIASISIGATEVSPFQKGIERYAQTDNYYLPADAKTEEIEQITRILKNYNLVITSVDGIKVLPKDRYGITDTQIAAIEQITSRNNSILVFFSNPYSLSYYKGIEKSLSAIVAYSDNDNTCDLASQLIFGATGTSATLPVSISDNYKAGSGLPVQSIGRLRFSQPEEEGFDAWRLDSTITSMVNRALHDSIFPGCQVLVAKNGAVVFQKSFGFLTYDSTEKVTNQVVYDWASVTKITGPLPLLMKLYQDSALNLDIPFSNYWTDFKKSNKSKIPLRDILTHQAQFKSGISFQTKLLKEEKEKNGLVFSASPSAKFPIRVASNLYARADTKQRMYDEIKNSELLKEKKYTYSDLGFYLFPELITQMTDKEYETLLYSEFLNPLGAYTAGYRPYNRMPLTQIAPTERDDYFRKELLRGFVHDEGAALLGGVSGNAGLFGSSLDLAKIMQFYLQGGHYGDLHLLNEKTLDEFTRVQFPGNNNRRALGFDKPYLNNKSQKRDEAYPSPGASERSFGHSGFTGTFTWVDPDNQLLFVFLTNRVYPSRNNAKLVNTNFRPRLYQKIIDCQGSFLRTAY